MSEGRIGLIVPTLGLRNQYLQECLESIRRAGDAYVVIVTPNPQAIQDQYSSNLYDQIVLDPGKGLAAAINLGISVAPDHLRYVSWLGDDDLLEPDALSTTSDVLDKADDVVFVYGSCKYIDERGSVIFVNRSGKYAKTLMKFGPQLIPQPGSLFRRSAFQAVGELDNTLKWAFDLDLFIKLTKVGRMRFIPQTVSSFRWHAQSLSVGGRQGSVKEASAVRRSSLPGAIRLLSPIWELPLRRLILFVGLLVNFRTNSGKK